MGDQGSSGWTWGSSVFDDSQTARVDRTDARAFLFPLRLLLFTFNNQHAREDKGPRRSMTVYRGFSGNRVWDLFVFGLVCGKMGE